jgi:hypothetical protein
LNSICRLDGGSDFFDTQIEILFKFMLQEKDMSYSEEAILICAA